MRMEGDISVHQASGLLCALSKQPKRTGATRIHDPNGLIRVGQHVWNEVRPLEDILLHECERYSFDLAHDLRLKL